MYLAAFFGMVRNNKNVHDCSARFFVPEAIIRLPSLGGSDDPSVVTKSIVRMLANKPLDRTKLGIGVIPW